MKDVTIIIIKILMCFQIHTIKYMSFFFLFLQNFNFYLLQILGILYDNFFVNKINRKLLLNNHYKINNEKSVMLLTKFDKIMTMQHNSNTICFLMRDSNGSMEKRKKLEANTSNTIYLEHD